MDYGTYLKKRGVRNNSQSKHYKRQSQFQGSRRQVRGKILKSLTEHDSMQVDSIRKTIEDIRVDTILSELEKEEIIAITDGKVTIA